MVQGFPVTAEFTHGVPCSSFALRSVKGVGDWPSRRSMCHMAGNSMHTSVSGIVMLYALTQVRMSQDMMMLQRFALTRQHHEPEPESTSMRRRRPEHTDEAEHAQQFKRLKGQNN